MREWVSQEDTFVLKQAKKKAEIRVKEGRAKPIDYLAVTFIVSLVGFPGAAGAILIGLSPVIGFFAFCCGAGLVIGRSRPEGQDRRQHAPHRRPPRSHGRPPPRQRRVPSPSARL